MENLDLTNIYFLRALVASLIIFLLAIYVLYKNSYSPVNKFFGAYAFVVVLWVFGSIGMDAAALKPEISVLWGKIGGIGGVLLGPMFLLFILAFTRNYKWLNNFFTHIVLLGISLFIFSWLEFVIEPTPIEELSRTFNNSGWESDRPWPLMVQALLAWIAVMYITGFAFCWKFYKKTKDALEKKQARLILIATTAPLILGFLSQGILPQLDLADWISEAVGFLFFLSSLVLVIPLAYAALKYKLFAAFTPAAAADVLVETMKDALIVVDTELSIEFVNTFTSDLVGYRKDELVGRPLSFIFSQKEKGWSEFNEKAILRLKQGKDVIDIETRLMGKNGEIIPISFSGSPFRDERGNLIGIVGVARDIRETTQLIAKLNETAEELQEVKRELERKIGGLIKP